MAFTDLATLKAMLGIPSTDTSRDAYLATLVAMADKVVLDVFALDSTSVTSYVDKIDVDDEETQILLTRRWPLVAVTSVVEDGDTLTSGTDYSSNDLGAIKLLPLNRWWAYGREKVVVTYTAGFATIPGDLAYAATLIAAFAFNTAQRAGFQSESIGQYSYTLGGSASGGSGGEGGFGIPPEAERILAGYRRVFALPN